MKKALFTLIALLALCLVCVSAASAEKDVPEGSWINYGELDEVTSIGGHHIIKSEWIIKPTCTEPGMKRCYCDTLHAGETSSSHTLYVKAEGHKWDSQEREFWGKVVKGPFCNAPGLAVDYCTVCGVEDETHTRTIYADHVYDEKHYEVVYPATCTESGWAVHTCIYCGQWNPQDAADWKYVVETPAYGYLLEGNTDLLEIPMKDHKWTEWTKTPAKNPCVDYGEAKRACEWCGATQELNKNNQSVVDHGKTIKIDEIIPLHNAKWNEEMAAVDGKTFNTENALFAALDQIKTSKYIAEEELVSCYQREVTLKCDCCEGKLRKYDPETGTMVQVHPDVVYTKVYPMTIAHSWELCEEFSKKPTCTEDGYDLYLCIHDTYWPKEKYNTLTKHEHGFEIVDGKFVEKDYYPMGDGFADPAYLKKPVAKLGHDWSEWVTSDEYKNKDGETVVRQTRKCMRKGCEESENRVVNIGDVKPEGTLKLDETDGKYKYYVDGEFQKDFTGFVNFQGGKFWVTKGVVDTELNGLVNCPGDKWYFFAKGQVQKVTQMAEYAGEWFMIKNGELDLSANGLYEYNGGKFAFALGRKLAEVNGIWQNPKDHVWYFLSQGQLQKYTGTATYDGATFELVDGVLVVK